MIEYERRILEGEMKRLERAWESAQERYAVTGSRSTDRTMTRYQVIMAALEHTLTDNRTQTLERVSGSRLTKLLEIRRLVREWADAGKLGPEEMRTMDRIISREE